MEKTWENFWTTGKVEDYLNYRNCVSDEVQRKQRENGQENGQEGQKEHRTWDSRLS